MRHVAVRTVEVPPRDVATGVDAVRQGRHNARKVNLDGGVLSIAEQKTPGRLTGQEVSSDGIPSSVQA